MLPMKSQGERESVIFLLLCAHIPDISMCQWEVHGMVVFAECCPLALPLDLSASGMVAMTTYSTGP